MKIVVYHWTLLYTTLSVYPKMMYTLDENLVISNLFFNGYLFWYCCLKLNAVLIINNKLFYLYFTKKVVISFSQTF